MQLLIKAVGVEQRRYSSIKDYNMDDKSLYVVWHNGDKTWMNLQYIEYVTEVKKEKK